MIVHEYKSYEEYVQIQVKHHYLTHDRTINKASSRRDDIKRIKEISSDAKSILCIGCRHSNEVKDFVFAGFNARGIDLMPGNPLFMDIMDMHDIEKKFGPKSWDIVYSSHSLEHSNDPKSLLNATLSVARKGIYIILPVTSAPTVKDPVLFKFMLPNSNACNASVEDELEELLGIRHSVIECSYRTNKNTSELLFFVIS